MPAKVARKKPVTKKPVKKAAARKPTPKKAPARPKAEERLADQSPPRRKKRSGPTVKRGMSFEEKAQMLLEYAKENGWWAKKEVKPILKLTAKKDDGRYKDTISCEWSDGKGLLLLCLEDGRTIRFRNLAAVMSHMDGTRTVKRDVQRRQRKAKRTVDIDGNVISRRSDDDYKPIGADIIDYWSHIRAKRPRGNTYLAPVMNIGVLLKPIAEKMAADLEAEGYEVKVVAHAGDGSCEYCLETPPSPKVKTRPKAPVAPSRPAAKRTAARKTTAATTKDKPKKKRR
jgi:hypothetical protein